MVYTNTFFNPIALSWNLGGGLFVSAGFNFTAPTGTKGGARKLHAESGLLDV